MGEVFWVSFVVTLLACYGLRVFQRRRADKAVRRENIWKHEDYRINVKLWELLHEEDPAWLVAMGIEPPRDVLLAQERKKEQERLRQQHIQKAKSLANLKPLTPWGDALQQAQAQQQSIQDRMRQQHMEQQMSQRYQSGIGLGVGGVIVDLLGRKH